MDKVVLLANVRKNISKASRSELRSSGRVPGIFYTKHQEPVAIDVIEKSLNPLVFTSKTHLIGLNLGDGQEFECIIKDVQFDPVTDKVIHFDLMGLVKGEKVQMEVPVVLTGSAIGVKDGGLLQQLLHKLNIECETTDIPQDIKIDVTDLKMGDAVHVNDLKFDKFEILNSEDAVIVAVNHPKTEKETVEGEEAVKEPEVITKGKEKEEE
ncbi:MAG TPA: 50S ribosomal protein L25 [Ignavibacteriaceae bacterium]|nr:50S ribosomal protein L25 [Ignavibacteriaceae bacterium]